MSNDGGFLALTGFLYQLIGSGSYALQVLEPVSETSLECANTSIILETYGQDMIARNILEGECIKWDLIQFKFSNAPDSNPVNPGELKEIVDAFVKSEESLRQTHGDKANVQFTLVTNRPRSSEVLDACNQNTNKRRQTASLLNRINWQEKTLYDFRDVLVKRALYLGITSDEIHKGVERLVSYFFIDRICLNLRSITQSSIDEQLAGFVNPCPISSVKALQKMKEDLDAFKQLNQAPQRLHSRRISDEINRSRGSTLIVLYGDGGSGKTMAACDFLESSLMEGCIANANRAEDIKDHYLSRIVARWRNCATYLHQPDEPQKALERVELSWVDGKGRVIFLVDAVDENRSLTDQSDLSSLIQMFANRNSESCGKTALDVSLILTCRDPQSLDRYLAAGGYRSNEPWGEYIRVDSFDREEFRQMLQRLLEEEENSLDPFVIKKILAECRPEPETIIAINDLTPYLNSPKLFSTSLEYQATPLAVSITDSLLHPVVWRCFTNCSSSDIQLGILNSQPESVFQLCEEIIFWFLTKARLRGVCNANNRVRATLLSAARALNAATSIQDLALGDRELHWIEAAKAQGIAAVEAMDLYDESISAGIIQSPVKDRWLWRHQFLREHLHLLRL